MSWHWLRYKTAVGHVVSHEFLGEVGHDLESRDCGELEQLRETGTACLDLGGCFIQGSPSVQVELDGLLLTVFCHQVAMVLARLDRLQVREGGYFKLHLFHSALVLSARQVDRLRDLLAAQVAVADERAAEHWRTWSSGK